MKLAHVICMKHKSIQKRFTFMTLTDRITIKVILIYSNIDRALHSRDFPAFLYQIGGHKIPTNFHVGRHRCHKPK